MTPRQRLLTALRRGQPDCVPMPLRMWKFLMRHYPDVEDRLERDLLAHDQFGVDVWHYSDKPLRPCFLPLSQPWREDVEVDVEHSIRGDKQYWERTIHTPGGDLHDVKCAMILQEGSGSGPEVVEPLVKDLKRDIPLLRYMHPRASSYNTAKTLEARERIGDRGITFGNMYSPIDCRSDVMRQGDFLMLYYDDKKAFREIVEIGAEAMMGETQAALAAGLEVIKTWWFYASPSAGWSPQIYEEMFLPHLARQVELVHQYGAVYVYYDDGKLRRFADFYVDAGVDCLMTCCPPPMGDADPEDMKRSYGDRVCLMGGIDVVNEVCFSNPERIRKTVGQRLRVYKPGGAYILDGSNSIPWETPVENVRALAEAGREYGAYGA
jgi:uroporphyrinogen-III decarboxylase